MGFHTFDHEKADGLEDPGRYRYCSREELLAAIDAATRSHVVDLGSGTGFYTDDLAAVVDRVSAIDIQPEMHAYYREKGVPENVELFERSTDDIPLADEGADAAVSTMTFHELPLEGTIEELRRVLEPGSPFVIVDWSANGAGEAGPPIDERYTVSEAVAEIEAGGFDVERASERPETFLVRSRLPK
ncbi:MAG: class I SAM-dependent methyltransferase [Halobacteriota archaeon]